MDMNHRIIRDYANHFLPFLYEEAHKYIYDILELYLGTNKPIEYRELFRIVAIRNSVSIPTVYHGISDLFKGAWGEPVIVKFWGSMTGYTGSEPPGAEQGVRLLCEISQAVIDLNWKIFRKRAIGQARAYETEYFIHSFLKSP